MENTREVVTEFKRRVNAEVRRQDKLNMTKEKNFKKGELLEKYTVKMLYG